MAPRIRHISQGVVHAQTEVTIESAAAVHLVRVLRVAEGAALIVADGCGNECDVIVRSVVRSKHPSLLAQRVSDWRPGVGCHRLRFHVIQALCKLDKIEHVLRTCTELGIAEFSVVQTERSIQQLSLPKLQALSAQWVPRLHAIANSAAEQSGRADTVLIHGVVALKTYLSATAPLGGTRLVASEKAAAHELLAAGPTSQGPIQLLIGPEGGLSVDEENAAQQAGFLRFSLGPRILRTETAAPASVAMLSALCDARTGQPRQ
jgi:16S rRNA (uracil1498-N3)-methyltransferase